MKTIRLPNRHRVTVPQYVQAWKLLRDPANQNRDYRGFMHGAAKGSVILQEMRKGLHDRINQNDTRRFTRKYDLDYQASLQRDANRVKDYRRSRIVIHQFETDIFRKRFAHMIAEREW